MAVKAGPSGAIQVFARCFGGWLLAVTPPIVSRDPTKRLADGGHPVVTRRHFGNKISVQAMSFSCTADSRIVGQRAGLTSRKRSVSSS
ncbi:hypothetical protein [Streptomyces pseudovenezuelae]|uniref:hypothetical protein n=1 Tax=Streptomyces pseudovenezuelae TaxID=67350 RepID=UPI0036EC5EAC